MRTVEELVLLAGETVLLWLRALPALVFWWGLGFAAHELAILASAALGAQHRTLATIVFVLGMVAQLAALILMIHSLRRHLQTRDLLAADAGMTTAGPTVPGRGRVLASTLGPFLAVYAVWGLTQTEVTRLVSTNVRLHGLTVADWSVQLTDWRFYAVLAVAAWVLRRLLELLSRGRRSAVTGALGQVAEGMWVLATFIAAVQLGRDLVAWLSTRQLGRWWVEGRDTLLATLGDWFGMRVPRVVEQVLDWWWSTGLPALTHGVALPLMWLALTATVFGWHLGARALARGTRWDSRLAHVASHTGGVGWAPVRWAAAGVSADWRDKWLPVLASLRLIAAAGSSVPICCWAPRWPRWRSAGTGCGW